MDPVKLGVDAYFELPESSSPMELLYGVVREPPAPTWGHQSVVTRIASLLDAHARRGRLGHVCVSPVDVVFDREAALVLQPDVVFVSSARMGMVRDRVWGAPDLIVEVLSPGTARHDRTLKLESYRRYGVREAWLVDPIALTVEVVRIDPDRGANVFEGGTAIRSSVLPGLAATVADLFA